MNRFFLFLLILSFKTFANDADYLNKYFANLNDFSADFLQLNFQNNDIKENVGTLKILKPKKFIWNYQTPTEQLIVNDGKKVYFYDKDLEQVTVYDSQELVGNLAAEILSNQKNLNKDFNISRKQQAPIELPKEALINGEIFLLTPKKDSDYKEIWLVMRDKKIHSLLLVTAQQKIALFFANVLQNQGLKVEEFVFITPKGVDVITQ